MLKHTVHLLISLFIAAPAFAQESLPDVKVGKILKLDELITEALQNNPQLRAARHQTSAAQTRVDQVTSWDAPQFGVEFFQTPIQSFPNPVKNGMETDYFLQQIKEDGVFDNLKGTKSKIDVDEKNLVVNVTLIFK